MKKLCSLLLTLCALTLLNALVSVAWAEDDWGYWYINYKHDTTNTWYGTYLVKASHQTGAAISWEKAHDEANQVYNDIIYNVAQYRGISADHNSDCPGGIDCPHRYIAHLYTEHAHEWNEGGILGDPTCTQPGWRDFACTTNGCSKVKLEPIPALGHLYRTGWNYDPGCRDEDGNSAHDKFCIRIGCDDVLGSHIVETCYGSEWDYNGGSDGWVLTDKHFLICEVCSNWAKTEPHCFGAWIVSRQPTSTEPGEEKHTCTKCQYTETRSFTHIHSFTAYKAVPATCFQGGNIAYQTCDSKECAGKYFDMLGNEIEKKDVFTSALDHMLEVRPEKNPTCLTAGKKTYYMCICCGLCWYDKLMTEPVKDLNDLVIPALGHLYDDTEWETDGPINHKHFCLRFNNPNYDGAICDAESKEATMQTEAHVWGKWHAVINESDKEERQCTKCTEKQTRQIGCNHMWTELKRESTCLDEGYQADKCIKCGLIVREQKLPALGHNWGEWAIVTPATIEAEGLEKRVCVRDSSHVETRPVAQLEPTTAPTAEPTATAQPTTEPTTAPTSEPTQAPTTAPTEKPTAKPGRVDVPKTGERSFAPAVAALMLCAAGALLLSRRK